MSSDIFNGLPGIFVGAFGEAVDYTPVGGSVRRINAIWTEGSGDSSPGLGIVNDIGITTLAVMEADLMPAEGDAAVRVKTGRAMIVATPIRPDGKGMIVCALVEG